MARRRRYSRFTPTISKTAERIAIAAFAAFAAHGGEGGIALSIVTIFLVVALVEELGRGWIYRGKRVTLRSLAYGYFARGGFFRPRGKDGRGKSRGRSRARKRRRGKVAAAGD